MALLALHRGLPDLPTAPLQYFVKQYQAIAHSKGRDVAGWEEIWHHFGTGAPKRMRALVILLSMLLDCTVLTEVAFMSCIFSDLDKSTIIHQGLGGSTAMPNLTSHGYRGIWSTDGVWYLDGLASTWCVPTPAPATLRSRCRRRRRHRRSQCP